jgi:hypothetical protein
LPSKFIKSLPILSKNNLFFKNAIQKKAEFDADFESVVTFNAPLILKMRDIIFFAGKLHNGPFQGIFRGGQSPYL